MYGKNLKNKRVEVIRLNEMKEKIMTQLKSLTIKQKFEVCKAINVYPDWVNDDINIDDDWCNRVANTINEDELNNLL